MRRKADLLDGSTFLPLDPLIHNYHASTSDLNILTLTNNQWTFSAMTSKRKNGGYSMGTFVQKIVKTELIRLT